MLTAERLREVLSYDPETGVFRWKVRLSNRALVGTVAGSRRPDGYYTISVDSQQFLAHRLAWLYVTGDWPAEEIDHKNCRKGDDRFLNLREATGSQNGANIRKRPGKSSRFKGVYWCVAGQVWVAQLKTTYLGRFRSEEAAHAAYAAAAKKCFGEYARPDGVVSDRQQLTRQQCRNLRNEQVLNVMAE